jgi:hypothetical protein
MRSSCWWYESNIEPMHTALCEPFLQNACDPSGYSSLPRKRKARSMSR